MEWKLDDNRPIWIQLQEQLTRRILSGWYHAGEKLPSVRELAAEAGVNPNTMQRALSELENRALVETRRTAGRTVTEELTLIQQVRHELARGRIQEFLTSMRALGYTEEQARALFAEWKEEIS